MSIIFSGFEKDYLRTTLSSGLFVYVTFINATVLLDSKHYILPPNFELDLLLNYVIYVQLILKFICHESTKLHFSIIQKDSVFRSVTVLLRRLMKITFTKVIILLKYVLEKMCIRGL